MESTKKLSKPGLPLAAVELLLEKLAIDDVFRTLFQASPAAALRQIGVEDPHNCADCMMVKDLASKEVVQQSRTALVSQLTSQLRQNVHLLSAR